MNPDEGFIPRPKLQSGGASDGQTRVTVSVTNSNIALAHSAFKDIGIFIIRD